MPDREAVWLVQLGEYSDARTVAAFRSKDAAYDWVAAYNTAYGAGLAQQRYNSQGFVLDEPIYIDEAPEVTSV